MSDLNKLIGKNIYIWDIASIHSGAIDRITTELVSAGFQSVILHSTRTTNWRQTARMNLVKALQAVGIHVFGGCAVYGDSAVAEGKRAADLCNEFKLTGWVFDAETAFDAAKSPDSAAANLLRSFRANAPAGCLAGWCWWAFYQSTRGAAWHPKSILWAAMTVGYGDADFGMPMTYWSGGDDAVTATRYLTESWKQWRVITDKPLIPIGRAYIGDGGTSKPAAMTAFEKTARELGAPGVSWWSMQHAVDNKACPGVWEALAGMKEFGEVDTDPVVETRKPWEELDQVGRIERLKTLAVAAGWNVD